MPSVPFYCDFFQVPPVFVLGGAGSIGSELVRQLSKTRRVVVVDIDETRIFDLTEELNIPGRWCDITDRARLEELFEEFRPDLVFHAAAAKHVSPNEAEPEMCVRVNVLGTLNVIKLCKAYGANMVNVSTDKVVNGESVMGLTKKLSERLVRNAGFVSVRFGNVMGSRGSVLPIWERQLAQGKPLTITHPDMERYVMTIPQAVELVIAAATEGGPGDVLVLDMGKPVKITDLANKFLEDHGKPDHPISIIGIRPGETMSERLWSDTEHPRKDGKFYVLSNEVSPLPGGGLVVDTGLQDLPDTDVRGL